MKMEDYIKAKQDRHRRSLRPLGAVEAMMITHERTGLLEATVRSFKAKTPDMPLTVFDDGSSSDEKRLELGRIVNLGVNVLLFPKAGFVATWLRAFEWMRRAKSYLGGVILLEDDLSFATGWDDVLRRMYEGAADLGYQSGAMSCLRVHDVPQARVLSLRGVDAYQSMGHSFQVNLMPWEVIENKAMIDQAAEETKRGKHGLDIYLLGAISDRMGRTNFMSTESWVAHEGINKSLVVGQGYRSLTHRGRGLVAELRREDDGDCKG